jgi:hypothetical protein
MTRKKSYSSDAACVLDCGCPLPLSFACSYLWNGILRSQTKLGAHASRVPYSASRRMHLLPFQTRVVLPDSKLTLTAKLTSKSNWNQAKSGQKINQPLSSPIARLFAKSQGYPSHFLRIFFISGSISIPGTWDFSRFVWSLMVGYGKLWKPTEDPRGEGFSSSLGTSQLVIVIIPTLSLDIMHADVKLTAYGVTNHK